MPTILQTAGYRLFFYSGQDDVPPHIHVERARKVAKFWLDPIRLEDKGRFNQTEINLMTKIIEVRQESLLKAWNEYFTD